MLNLPCHPASSYPPKHSRAGPGTWDHLRCLLMSIFWHLRLPGCWQTSSCSQERVGLSYIFRLLCQHHVDVSGASQQNNLRCLFKHLNKARSHMRWSSEFSLKKNASSWCRRNPWRPHHCLWVTSVAYWEFWLFLSFTHWSLQVSKSKYASLGASLCVHNESAAGNDLMWLYEMRWNNCLAGSYQLANKRFAPGTRRC